MSIQSFKIAIPQASLDDLQDRLARTRWPDEVEDAGWDYGTNLGYMKELADYWQHQYDWRKQEAELNTFAHFKAEIDGVSIHFIHERGKGPNPLPIILTHGWPGSFCEMLNSPVGLAGWIVEKFRSWSDCAGDVEKRFTKDELLTTITLYWVTETINAANRLYYETAHDFTSLQHTGKSDTPAAIARFPKDILPAPRQWAERWFNVQRWTAMPRGGHFAALEEPELLVEDIRAFFRLLRA